MIGCLFSRYKELNAGTLYTMYSQLNITKKGNFVSWFGLENGVGLLRSDLDHTKVDRTRSDNMYKGIELSDLHGGKIHVNVHSIKSIECGHGDLTAGITFVEMKDGKRYCVKESPSWIHYLITGDLDTSNDIYHY